MNNESVREKFKGNPRLKRFVDWLIMNQVETRPRWYVRMLAPLYQHRGRHSVIHRSVRMDTPPYRQFRLGSYSVIESGACINNAVGDVIIGDHTRIGLHNTIIGPVTIGNHVNLAQGITVTALNHNFTEPGKRIDEQGVSTTPVTIEDDVWIGATWCGYWHSLGCGRRSHRHQGCPTPLLSGRCPRKSYQTVMRIN